MSRSQSDKLVVKHKQIDGFRDEIAEAEESSPEQFFSWFNKAGSVEDSFRRGAWDFSSAVGCHLAPLVLPGKAQAVLEIGYGGGRLLAAAARHFDRAIGIDVHGKAETVSRELEKRGIKNFSLIQSTGWDLPVPDASLDAVYSFIVLQHVGLIKVLISYLEETARVLRPGGAAVLYFGRWSRFSDSRSQRALYWVDRALERVVLRDGYQESSSVINDVNLQVTVPRAKQLAALAGLETLDVLVSRRFREVGRPLYGRQSGLVLRRS